MLIQKPQPPIDFLLIGPQCGLPLFGQRPGFDPVRRSMMNPYFFSVLCQLDTETVYIKKFDGDDSLTGMYFCGKWSLSCDPILSR